MLNKEQILNKLNELGLKKEDLSFEYNSRNVPFFYAVVGEYDRKPTFKQITIQS